MIHSSQGHRRGFYNLLSHMILAIVGEHGRVVSSQFCLFCKLPSVGLDVSLADRETLAPRSTRVFVANHCSEPLIPRKVVNPVASNLSFPFNRCRFFGRLCSAVDSFVVNSC